ncbi:hypothetical protein CIK98_16345 [Prevotella sp. P2-180]|nr:hypothetical protein CIK98_16345 [Prevotella sp. P2-180]
MSEIKQEILMKKYFLLLLSVLFCSACSSDTDDNQENVIDGTYKYHEGGIAVSVFISKGQCCGMTIYNDNKVCFQGGSSFIAGGDFNTIGTYPNFSYYYDKKANNDEEWMLKAEFSGKEFKGTPQGKLFQWHNSKELVVFPSMMNFKLSNEVLDKNGDGILDSSQGI